MTRHFYVILNRHAGRGYANTVWHTIKPQLDQLQIAYQVTETKYAGHATLLAEQYAKHHADATTGSQIVLVVGGDGTLNQALNGLKQATVTTPLPLAYIPAGSGNDFARGAQVSRNPSNALKQILTATEPEILDIGHYEETTQQEQRYFVNNVGIGFDAAVVSAANHSDKKSLLNRLHLGNLAYVGQLIKVLGQQTAFPVTVNIGNHRDIFNNAFLVTTSNHPYFGGGVPILPIANVHDGKLSLIIAEKMILPKFIFLFIMMTFGRHLGFKHVHHYQATHLQLTVSSLEYGQVDGEEMGNRFFDIHLSVDHYPFWFAPSRHSK
ncbi:MAG TPA: diacylglycerol kinase [Lactobacillus sp.]|nr:diacylglycerol kinase [Lactobacillus sp.]